MDAIKVSCPWCFAKAGKPCKYMGDDYHLPRQYKATQQQLEKEVVK